MSIDQAPRSDADRRRSRRGSDASDRQIANAAMRGRRVIFMWLATQPRHEIQGYVVGMDDYHWLVASPIPESDRTQGEDPITLSLVHRTASVIKLPPQEALTSETNEVQEAVRRVGQGFWSYCENTYGPSRSRTEEN